ncbi:MAG: alpha-L-fucosidase [Spirochaetia bacterium]
MRDQQEWFSKAGFGIFIHFGLYSLMGGNENNYQEMDPGSYRNRLLPQFNPERFDAAEWAARIKESGARYAVITTKHGEGFCLWHTRTTDFHIGNTPFQRDLIRELADAVRNAGLRFGIYFAADNWYYRESGRYDQTAEAYTAFVSAQLEELTADYGRTDLLWLDGFSDHLPPDQLKNILDACGRRQPSLVVNDRGVNQDAYGGHLGDFITPERFFPEKYDTEQGSGKIEICDAMGLKGWGYHNDQHFHTSPELIYRLCLSRSMGANYLLNVEPQPGGIIRKECTDRLADIGRWLEKSGDTVFGVQPGNALVYEVYENQRFHLGCTTRKDDTVYVHLARWPRGDRIILGGLTGNVKSVRISPRGPFLPAVKTDSGAEIRSIPSFPDSTNPVLEVLFSAPPQIDNVYALPRPVIRVEPELPTWISGESAELIPALGETTWHCHKTYMNGARTAGRWVRTGLSIEWKLAVEKGGKYRIIAYLGTTEDQADAVGEFTAGGERVTFVTRATGDYTEPRGLDAGVIRLDPGEVSLRLASVKMKRFFPDVHHLILVPSNSR